MGERDLCGPRRFALYGVALAFGHFLKRLILRARSRTGTRASEPAMDLVAGPIWPSVSVPPDLCHAIRELGAGVRFAVTGTMTLTLPDGGDGEGLIDRSKC